MGSPAPISEEIRRSAKQGELQKVFKWLRKGRLVGALFPTNTAVRSGCDHVQHGFGVLHAAAAYDQVETVRELLIELQCEVSENHAVCRHEPRP